MPRFYFDTDDGERRSCDETGIDLSDVSDVPSEVMGLLCDLVQVHLPVGCRALSFEIADVTNGTVCRGKMTIVGEVPTSIHTAQSTQTWSII